MKWYYLPFLVIAILFLFLWPACKTTGSDTATTVPKEYFLAEEAYTLTENKLDFTFTLKSSGIPGQAKYMEVIFDNKYYGFFAVDQPVYLLKFTGKKRLILFFSDDTGKSTNARREIILIK